MKHLISKGLLVLGIAALLASCSKECGPCPGAIKQTHVHRYGVECSKKDWEARGSHGQIITVRKDGTVHTESFEGGRLHGETTQTFPFSEITALTEEYSHGQLVARQENFRAGTPQRRVEYKPNGDWSLRTWYEDGTPRCREFYCEDYLTRGEYFTPNNALDARVTDGQGMRVVRNDAGQMISEEVVVAGQVVKQSTFYPNGDPESVIPYVDGLVHGTVRTFTEGGLPYSLEEWVKGEQHGITTLFDNGQKVSEITFQHGVKQGVEKRFNANGQVSEEITWVANEQHGPTRYYVDGHTGIDWYHHGNVVSKTTFDRLNGTMPM